MLHGMAISGNIGIYCCISIVNKPVVSHEFFHCKILMRQLAQSLLALPYLPASRGIGHAKHDRYRLDTHYLHCL